MQPVLLEDGPRLAEPLRCREVPTLRRISSHPVQQQGRLKRAEPCAKQAEKLAANPLPPEALVDRDVYRIAAMVTSPPGPGGR